MSPRISIRACVRPSVHWSVCLLVHVSVHLLVRSSVCSSVRRSIPRLFNMKKIKKWIKSLIKVWKMSEDASFVCRSHLLIRRRKRKRKRRRKTPTTTGESRRCCCCCYDFKGWIMQWWSVHRQTDRPTDRRTKFITISNWLFFSWAKRPCWIAPK